MLPSFFAENLDWARKYVEWSYLKNYANAKYKKMPYAGEINSPEISAAGWAGYEQGLKKHPEQAAEGQEAPDRH